jgi:ABC-type multidrug transport system fused ATPase/permease subunit
LSGSIPELPHVEKVFWERRTKSSRTADAFRAQRREGPHRITEPITGLRNGAAAHLNSGIVQKSAFARFLASFDFRLFQQYPPKAATGLIDGLMSVLMLALMFTYSVQLGFVVLFAFALYAALRLALFSMFRQRSEAAIHTKAHENSTFIETVRAVQSLKLLNRENERESQWLNRYAAYRRVGRRNSKADVFQTQGHLETDGLVLLVGDEPTIRPENSGGIKLGGNVLIRPPYQCASGHDLAPGRPPSHIEGRG